MRKVIDFLLGIGIGASIGAALIGILSRPKVKNRLQQHTVDAHQTAQHAARERRCEMEAELETAFHPE